METTRSTDDGRRSGRGALALKLAFGLAWTLVAAEFFLRWLHPIPMLPRYIQATDFGIRGNMPDAAYTHRTPDYRVDLRTNSRGVRADEEIPYEKPLGTVRVVLLGDSFAMGYGANLEETFLHQMRERLQPHTDEKIEVVNLAVSGFGTAEALVMLENEGFRYEPDLVISTWHRSDLDDNARSGLFALREGELVRDAKTYLPGVKVREFLFSFSAYRWLAGNSHLYNFYREFLAKQIKSILVELRRKPAKPSEGDEEMERGDADLAEVEGSEVDDPSAGAPRPLSKKQELTAAILDHMKKACEERGARFLVLDIPRRMSRTEFVGTFLPREEIERRGWDVAEVLPLLRREAGEDVVLYWENSHGHFTPRGCSLVAEALEEAILERGWLGTRRER